MLLIREDSIYLLDKLTAAGDFFRGVNETEFQEHLNTSVVLFSSSEAHDATGANGKHDVIICSCPVVDNGSHFPSVCWRSCSSGVHLLVSGSCPARTFLA